MGTREERYISIRNRLTSAPCSNDQLSDLKQHFRDSIDSDRRYDRIISLTSLIKMLEKRDIINSENIRPLSYVAGRLQIDAIISLIGNFDVTPNVQPIHDVAGAVDRVLPNIDPDLINRVYDVICMEIGQKWKDFARALKIQEGFIDELEYRHRNRISEMVREILVYHREFCDPTYWKCELCNALADARRRDLSRVVERLFARHALRYSV